MTVPPLKADILLRLGGASSVPEAEVAPVGRYLPWRACSVDCLLKSLRVVTVIGFAIEALLQRLHDCAAAGQAAFVNMQTRVPQSGTNECLGTLRVDTFCAYDDDAARHRSVHCERCTELAVDAYRCASICA